MNVSEPNRNKAHVVSDVAVRTAQGPGPARQQPGAASTPSRAHDQDTLLVVSHRGFRLIFMTLKKLGRSLRGDSSLRGMSAHAGKIEGI